MEERDCSGWTTSELFTYAIANALIADDEVFEDWMNCRTDLYEMVRDDLNNW